MAIVHGLYRNMVNVDVCIESEPLEVQVPLTFFRVDRAKQRIAL